ncbi:MAG: DegT/DnrJ/EryC1/StrS family aminotransferase [Deltaproteobacteria bacterium]|nr:DegT/DnrJ/EryC1/StrS family aminotransferase [Deltaproteobacteria bacterium]
MPYWNGATYRNILYALASGGVVDGPDLGRLKSLLIDKLDLAEAVLCGSGSLAVEIALRSCGVREGDEVVIPTFCCTAVVAPILAAGAIPVLADAGEELNITAEAVDAVLTEKTRAIVVPHLFGNPANIDPVIEIARARNIRVIDDAAQAVGATIGGRPAGSFGDAGVLSFGSEKVCFGLGGGVVVSRQKEVLNGGSQTKLAPPRLSPAVRSFFSTTIWRRWRRWTLPVKAALSHVKGTGPDSPPVPYRQESMANLNATVALSLLETLDENIAARRARVGAYQDLLGTEEGLELIPHRGGSACLTQVVRVFPKTRVADPAARLIQVLGSAGYEVQGSYVPIHLLSRYRQWVREPLPYAERLWGDLIELPCEPEVSFDHMERIALIVKQVLNS